MIFDIRYSIFDIRFFDVKLKFEMYNFNGIKFFIVSAGIVLTMTSCSQNRKREEVLMKTGLFWGCKRENMNYCFITSARG